MSAVPGRADEEARLLDVPDVAGALRRDWPRFALRAGVAVLVPLFTTLLIGAFDLVAQLQDIVPVIAFLRPAAPGYGPRVVAFLVLVLVVGSFALPRRTGQALLAIATAVVLAVGFNHSQLQWTRLFVFGFDSYATTPLPATGWVWAGLLLATVVAYILAEEVLDTRRAQTERALPDDETRAVQRVARQGALLAALGGALLAGALLGLVALLAPLASGQTLFPRLNPVYLLFGLGVLLVLAVLAGARRSGAQQPEAPPAPPPPPAGYVRVPVQGPPAAPPPPPPRAP